MVEMTEVKSSSLTIVRGPDSLTLSTSRGQMWVVRRAPDVLVYRFEGYVAEEMFEPSMVFTNAAIERYPTIVLIGDGEGWEGYESGYRKAWTVWFSAHRRQVRSAHLLSLSSMVRMGGQVINLALRAQVLHIYKDRREFDAAVANLTSRDALTTSPR